MTLHLDGFALNGLLTSSIVKAVRPVANSHLHIA